MRTVRELAVLVALSLFALAIVGCERKGSVLDSSVFGNNRTAAHSSSPEELGRLGARLEAQPDRAEEILQVEGLTWDDFSEAVRDIAADTELASRYEEGYREESARLGGGVGG